VSITSETYIDWLGASGSTYRYWFLEAPKVSATIKDEGGNYAFVKQLPNGNFIPLYFGEGESLRGRIPSHDRWNDALRLGATHVMSHTTPVGSLARLVEERDLIQKWNPPLNTQHRTTG